MSAEEEKKCGFFDGACKIEGIIGESLGAVAYDLLDKAGSLLTTLSTVWLDWSPGIDTESNAVAQIQGNLWWFTGMIAILGILLALGRMVLSNDFKTLIGAAKPIVNLIIVTGAYTAGIRMLDDSTHALAEWMFQQIESNEGESVGLEALADMIVMSTGGIQAAIGGALIVGLLSLLGTIVLFGFMVFRDVVLLIMLAFIPTLAAATGSETGDQAFKKANGWLLALLLFKPVAAVILALGITLMKDNTDISGADEGTLMRPVAGVLIVCLASLALPALIKFVVPAAAAGAGAFSGGGALALGATVAGGAAVVAATAGTGGAAAAGGAGAATTTAGTSGAGSTGAGVTGGAAGGEAAGAAPTPGGGGGAGGDGGGGASPDGAPTGGSGETADSAGDSGSDTGTAGGGADGASPSSGDPSTGGGDATADSAAGADQSESSTNSGGPAPQPAGGSDGGGMSASDMAVMTQALGSGAEQSTSGLDEAAEGA